MSDGCLQHFRSLLTERFTAVAVEILAEVERLVEARGRENRRLRELLHTVVGPEVRLPRVDIGRCAGVSAEVREPLPDMNTGLDAEMGSLPRQPKEEQTEYDISVEPERRQEEPGEVGQHFSSDCVKSDPEEAMSCVTDSFQIQIVDCDPDFWSNVSSYEESEDGGDSDGAAECSHLSSSEVSKDEDMEAQKHRRHTKKKRSESSLQKTMLEFPRIMRHKPPAAAPTSFRPFLERLTEACKDLPEDKKPLITKFGLADNVESVDCAFGNVPKGGPLSHQRRPPSSQDYRVHDDAPPQPPLPLAHTALPPMPALPPLGAKEQEHVAAMNLTWEGARELERSTRHKREPAEESQEPRLTARFREICKLKPGSGRVAHLIFKIKGGQPSCKKTEAGEEMKAQALREYCRTLCVNWSPCGLVVHPDAPWLGALPDGVVYDPHESPSFGLVHVKCPGVQNFTDCGFLVCKDGLPHLREDHAHYWHVQAEMMVTGLPWCDLLVFSEEDILVQRVYRDRAIMKLMKRKLDDFFFLYYLPSLF